ncbi:hypothetical protein T440DRAFT_491266 [Plenodomus tracheiphilus IPT5]|uniref:Transcription elongation factor Eaf N-terminal domain-containing protein n=1 Tax=Plenodomus tracheiphilus IPT5 TaxID=1408161 RepID=A0A6A7AYL5_9PLEO|nr:hypothetical protein T440DRAFT_491266 [Plenodomus tracheiphilus IPT5]
MASPIVERIEPHKKAHFNLHISDRIASSDASSAAYRSVKYNHKPAQTSESRTTTLTSLSANTYNLKLEDSDSSGTKDIFTFKGQGSTLKKSYVLVFDPSSQQATLEPLSSSCTFNLATKNGKDVSSQHPKIYPKKYKDDANHRVDEEDLFGEAVGDDEAGDPDPENPYDFRHFLGKEKEKRGDESEYHFASSPDYRTGTGSAANTPQFGARNPAAAPQPKTTKPAPAKRKAPTTSSSTSKTKKAQPTPAVVLQRTATSDAPKSKSKAAAAPASKIKSKEIIDSSDESDNDADGEIISSPPRRSPSPARHRHRSSSPSDAEGESDDDGGLLEIEVPDAQPPRRGHGALKSLGLGQNLGVGGLTRSPSTGPRSLLSATNSAQGSPNPQSLSSRANRNMQDEIDFGDLEDAEGEDEDEEEEGYDRDVDPMDLGPPARQGTVAQDRKASTVGGAAEDDEDDLEKMMLEGLAGGDSSEESEEE